MAASTKTKVVAKNISRVALISEEATKYLAQKYQLTRQKTETYWQILRHDRDRVLLSWSRRHLCISHHVTSPQM